MQLVKTTMMMAGALLLALNVCGQENVPAGKKLKRRQRVRIVMPAR